jgi:hypothetical protein
MKPLVQAHHRAAHGVAFEVRPRPVFCVVEHAYRDRAVAEMVCTGRFNHGGITVDLGPEPDWLRTDLPADPEWQIEWSKFYYGLNLAHAFHETGDPKFLHTWAKLVRSWIRQVPVSFDRSDVTGRRILNWIYAWNRFVDAPAFRGLPDGLADELLQSLSDQVAHLREHLTPERNHRTLELYALFIAALALPVLDPDQALLDFAITELHRNLLTDIRPDGVHREASTHYHHIVLRSFLGARENARRFGLSLPHGFYDRLERACEFALHCHRPDGTIPALSDSDTGSYLELLELAASLFSRPDFLYVATGGARGVPPRQRCVSFPEGGYYIQRSGWGEGDTPFRNERHLIFDCGPLGDGSHGHYDLLSVDIAGGGRPLIVDPGRYTYSEQPPNWRRWFKGTAAHNTVLVDGLDQTPYQRGKPSGTVATGCFLRRLNAPGLDVLWGEALSPCYEVVHQRRVVFVADEYWIIEDRVWGTRSHRYELRFHLSAEAWNRTRLVRRAGKNAARSPGLVMVFASPHQVCIEPGWIAPSYGTKLPAPVVVAVADGLAETTFLTLAVPSDSSTTMPTVRVQRHQVGDEQVTLVEVNGVGPGRTARDLVAWSASAKRTQMPSLQCVAAAAWLRESADGECLAFRTCDVAEVISSAPRGSSVSQEMGR